MHWKFSGEERNYAPDKCEYWQSNRIPQSPLQPKARFSRWLQTDSEENYHARGNKSFSIESVGYEFNSLGYRGQEFDPREAGVLFLGDSNTFGLGMPWENLWSTLVVSYLASKWRVPVQQLNLAWGGTANDYSAMMLHQAVDVLKPARVFVLWTFATRMTWFPDPRNPVHFIAEWRHPEHQKDHAAYLRLATEAHGFFSYVRDFHFVNERLGRLGIPLYWGNIERLSPTLLGTYLPLDGYVGQWQRVDLARDGLHGGIQSHRLFSKLMIAAVELREGALSQVDGG